MVVPKERKAKNQKSATRDTEAAGQRERFISLPAILFELSADVAPNLQTEYEKRGVYQ